MTLLSFVIPCYGSEKTIEYVVNEIIEVVSQRKEYDYEIICVNDASPDNVLEILTSLASSNKRIKVIDLAKNRGKTSAIMAGYNFVSGDIVINLDDDGQCPMDKLWDLIECLSSECDVAIAKYPKKKQSAFKNFGSRVNNFTIGVLIGKPRDIVLNNFSVVKKFVINEVINYKNPYPYLSGLFFRTTSKIKNVVMEERTRYDGGKGNFTFSKSFSLWINGLTAFSVIPLRFASFIGIICAFFGFAFGLFTIVRKLVASNVSSGWSSIFSTILFIGGLIMLMLGVIGEYIGRIYISINNAPQYVIRNIINTDECNVNKKSE